MNNKLDQIELLVYDFDGVMTDGAVYVDTNGVESVRCHRRDGYAIDQFRLAGKHQIILTSERNDVVKRRAEKLCIGMFSAPRSKDLFIIHFCEAHNYKFDSVAFVGDYLNDVDALRVVGHRFCPSDSCSVVKNLEGMHVLETGGGDGVVAEMWEYFNQ